MEKRSGNSFYDLEVYQNTYQASLTIFKKILPQLPQEERYDLTDQLRRSAKAVPRLIAESYSKRYQKKGFQSLHQTHTQPYIQTPTTSIPTTTTIIISP